MADRDTAAAPPKKKAPSIRRRNQATAHVPVAQPTQALRVIATKLGFYDHKRRRPGDVFVMDVVIKQDAKTGEDYLDLPSWTELAPRNAELKETGAQEALNAEQDKVRLTKQPGAQPAPSASSGDDLGI